MRPIGLRKRLALAGERTGGPTVASAGEVFWGHATSADRLRALLGLGDRLKAERPALSTVFTFDARRITDALPAHDATILPIWDDLPASGRSFLNRWEPDVCVWSGGHLRRNILGLAAWRDTDLILTDADADGFDAVRRGLWRSPVTTTLESFAAILAVSDAAVQALERLGAPADRIERRPPLQAEPTLLPCREDTLQRWTDGLAGRQIWLAAHVAAEEIDAVIHAHRHAVRRAHRLLLVIVPDRHEDMDLFRARMHGSGLRWSDTEDDSVPDTLQALLWTDPDQLGLWYRLAPIAFIGCSLWPGLGGRDPMQAASLGSAVLSGPNVRSCLAVYDRLTRAGAARVVREAEALADAVVQLSAPDRSAAMALAAWELATEGAETMDRLMELVQDRLDRRGARDASS